MAATVFAPGNPVHRIFAAFVRVVGVFRGFLSPRTTRNTRTGIFSAVRRGIFVEPETKTISVPSGRHILPVRFMLSLLTELGNLLRVFYKDFTPTAFGDSLPSHKWLGYYHRFAFAQHPAFAPAFWTAPTLLRFFQATRCRQNRRIWPF